MARRMAVSRTNTFYARHNDRSISPSTACAATGQPFWAAVDTDSSHDAHNLEEGKRFSGHLFESVLTEPDRTAWCTSSFH